MKVSVYIMSLIDAWRECRAILQPHAPPCRLRRRNRIYPAGQARPSPFPDASAPWLRPRCRVRADGCASSSNDGGAMNTITASGRFCMHLHRALHLDLEDNIIAGLQLFVHRSLQRAVVVINVLRVLEERIGGDLRLKVLFREEIILYAVLFARTRRTGRRRDREEQLLVLGSAAWTALCPCLHRTVR